MTKNMITCLSKNVSIYIGVNELILASIPISTLFGMMGVHRNSREREIGFM